MIKVLICCGGGFSSSYMVKRVQNDIIAKGYQDKLMVEYSPFDLSAKVKDNFDVVMCCPHVALHLEAHLKAYGRNVPYYIFPNKMYGRMYVEDIYQDALDIIEGFEKTGMNPFHFPGEGNYMASQRTHSYRHHFPQYKPEDLEV